TSSHDDWWGRAYGDRSDAVGGQAPGAGGPWADGDPGLHLLPCLHSGQHGRPADPVRDHALPLRHAARAVVQLGRGHQRGQGEHPARRLNLDTYRAVAQNDAFWRSYGNTVLYTVLGTTIAMVLTTTYAFVLSK